jgi:hypothetical protein
MQDQHTFIEIRNARSVSLNLFPDFYKKNCHSQTKNSAKPYVFVFSIILKLIGIRLFPSITPVHQIQKSYEKHIGTFFSVSIYRF